MELWALYKSRAEVRDFQKDMGFAIDQRSKKKGFVKFLSDQKNNPFLPLQQFRWWIRYTQGTNILLSEKNSVLEFKYPAK